MNENVQRIMRGYSELDLDSRKAVKEFIKDFEEKAFKEKEEIRKDFNKSLGPTSDMNCPCCGR